MLMQLFTIFDEAAQESGEVFMAKNRATAKRFFDLGLAKIADVSKKDYSLFHLGQYDTEKMEITVVEPMKVHLNVNDDVEVML